MGIFDGFFKQIAAGDNLKDYTHASKLFRSYNYALAPKHGFLYHVFFDINPSLTFVGRDQQLEAGMLVKNVDLPKFTFDTKVLNSYNRPNVVQTKIKYDSVNIAFHDDMSNVVRNLWFDYYNYYYRDADNGFADSSGAVNPNYYQNHKYQPGPRDVLNRFGYHPRSSGGDNKYFQSIRIYSLYKRQFSEYTLINPIITNFSHGSHGSESASSTLDHTMTISYESILYASGYVTSNTVKGFADLHYDKSPSPLSALGGGTNSILGPGGILSAADEISRDATGGNYGAAAFKLLRSYDKNKNINLTGLAKGELVQAGLDMIAGRDPRDKFFVPYNGARAARTSPPTALTPASPGASSGSIISNGKSLSGIAAAGIGFIGATAVAGNPSVGAAVGLASGIIVNSSGSLSGGPINKVVKIGYNSPLAVQGIENPADTYSYAKSLQKLAENRSASVQSASLDNSGILAAPVENPVFEIGSNTKVVDINPLQQTPYSNKFIPKQVTVANREAAKFISKGNPNTDFITGPGSQIGGKQTPPIP